MSKSILIVEDDENVRATMELLLSHAGFKVILSSTGKDIYQIIGQQKPDLILLDVFLGDLDGRDICRELKNNPDTSDIPIIIVSSLYNIYNTILEEKANDVIPKPFTEDILLSRVQRHMPAAC